MPWSPLPGGRGRGPQVTLFAEAFGQLSRNTDLPGIVSDEEDLYSVFMRRGGLMGWDGTPRSSRLRDVVGASERRPLWGMHEAEVTATRDASRIGFVQVGLEAGVEPVEALSPLIQCFDDALRRFGAVEVSAFQVVGTSVRPGAGSLLPRLSSALNWFNTVLTGTAEALVVIDSESLGERSEAELVAFLGQVHTGSFHFGPVVSVPEEHSIAWSVEVPSPPPPPAQSGLSISVTMPEWTASAAGWVLAMVLNATRTGGPDVDRFAVRVSRVR